MTVLSKGQRSALLVLDQVGEAGSQGATWIRRSPQRKYQPYGGVHHAAAPVLVREGLAEWTDDRWRFRVRITRSGRVAAQLVRELERSRGGPRC